MTERPVERPGEDRLHDRSSPGKAGPAVSSRDRPAFPTPVEDRPVRGRAATPELEAERRRKIADARRGSKVSESAKKTIGAKTANWWASPKGEAMKEKMRRERTGRRTPAQERMAERHRRIYAAGRAAYIEGLRKRAEELGLVEPRQEAGGPPVDPAGKNDPEQGDGPREGS